MCVLLTLPVSGRQSVLVARLFPSVGRTPLLSVESLASMMWNLLYYKIGVLLLQEC